MAKNEINLNVNITGVEDIRKLIEELQAKLADAPAVEPLKVGDYVKVVDAVDSFGFKRNGVNSGDVRLIIKADGTEVPHKAKILDGNDCDWFRKGALVLATDEEVAEAKAELERKAESEKWAKIGRKPNEFKRGDIVEVTTDVGGAPKIGDLLEVDRQLETDVDVIRVSDIRGYILHNPKLITPVGAKFNA